MDSGARNDDNEPWNAPDRPGPHGGHRGRRRLAGNRHGGARSGGRARRFHGLPYLWAGDLVFFAGPDGAGAIHHVGIYIGGGMTIDSPRTGLPVREVAVSAFGSEYPGARRYL
jgi:NlpC/P60 family